MIIIKVLENADTSINNKNFEFSGTFEANEDSTTFDILEMLRKAVILDEYYEVSFYNACKKYVEEYEYENNIGRDEAEE